MSKRPRFRFIPTLGVSASSEAAQNVLGEGLGLPLLDADDAHQAYGRGRLSLYVDTTGAAPDLAGFTPMLGTDDLQAALEHLASVGCTHRPMPWAEEAPGALVEGPGGLRFCVVPLDEVVNIRAQRFLDDESREGAPLSDAELTPPQGRALATASSAPANTPSTDPHRRPTVVGGPPLLVDRPSETESSSGKADDAGEDE